MKCLILFAIFAIAVTATPNNCSFPAQSFTTYEQVLDCIENFKLDTEIFQNTMKALQMTMGMYVFRDWVKDSPPSKRLLHIQESK
jgi:hypothetical protein